MNTRQKIRSGILLISMLLFPVTLYYFSPYLSLAGLMSGIVSGSVLMFCLQFLSSLFLGRAFCGWICPAGGIQEEIVARIRKKPVRSGNWIKWVIWIPWAAALLYFAVRGTINAIDPLYMTDHGISVSGLNAYVTYYSVLGLIIIPAFIFGKRSFCHHICWMAPFMILGLKLRNLMKLPGLRLGSKNTCIHCGTCAAVCPMSLNVRKSLERSSLEKESECILCGNCVDNCPESALYFRFRKNMEIKNVK